jgi:hypothetical protein
MLALTLTLPSCGCPVRRTNNMHSCKPRTAHGKAIGGCWKQKGEAIGDYYKQHGKELGSYYEDYYRTIFDPTYTAGTATASGAASGGGAKRTLL